MSVLKKKRTYALEKNYINLYIRFFKKIYCFPGLVEMIRFENDVQFHRFLHAFHSKNNNE